MICACIVKKYVYLPILFSDDDPKDYETQWYVTQNSNGILIIQRFRRDQK